MIKNLRPHYHSSPRSSEGISVTREKAVFYLFLLSFVIIWGRFFYLQILKGSYYEAKAQKQYQQSETLRGDRGKIYSSDEYLLAGNHNIYRLYAIVDRIEDAGLLYDQIAPTILADKEASGSLRTKESFAAMIAEKSGTSAWISLANKVGEETKNRIVGQEIKGLYFEPAQVRFNPEATLAAHVLGYVGRDGTGGRYGVEGGADKELEGKTTQILHDAGKYDSVVYLSNNMLHSELSGRDLYLTLRHDLQVLAEDALKEGMARYGAMRGEIIITEPKTGKILALAAAPAYEPANYPNVEDASIYKNPAVVDLYEPGSTFKVLTVAAGVDAGVIAPDTVCKTCGGPRRVADATIETWNDVYYPGITMVEALEKSDNTAMVYVTDLLGSGRFRTYLEKFGIGQPLDLEIEEDVVANFPEVWGPVETATRAFGQGVSVTSLQLIRAVGAIANEGKMMKPYVVEKAIDKATGTVYQTEPEVLTKVVSPAAAKTVSKMMQAAAQHGEAQYIYKNTERIAGKTGTAQIPERGGYSEETIASFIGFAPYDDPKFLMMVKFERPQSSPWAAETAALTWNEIAEKLMVIFNIN